MWLPKSVYVNTHARILMCVPVTTVLFYAQTIWPIKSACVYTHIYIQNPRYYTCTLLTYLSPFASFRCPCPCFRPSCKHGKGDKFIRTYAHTSTGTHTHMHACTCTHISHHAYMRGMHTHMHAHIRPSCRHAKMSASFIHTHKPW